MPTASAGAAAGGGASEDVCEERATHAARRPRV